MENIKQFLSLEKLLTSSRQNKGQTILLIVGILLLVFGILTTKFSGIFSSDKVEVLGDSSQNETLSGPELVVEISGAVEKPGVYKLPSGSRINDLLISSGGLSENADREWVDKTINKAAKLTDGQKIYVPELGQTNANNIQIENANTQTLGEQSRLININTATQKELESLPGIGPVYGAKIIEQRPYSDVQDLVSKKIIPQSTFDKIKDKVSVY